MLHRENATLRVRLVGGVEKWENRKLWEDGKVGGQKRFYFIFFLFGWEQKSGEMEKMNLKKFTHIPLLKNDANFFFFLKTNNHTKKSNHPKFFIKIKNMFQKKSHPIKIKINYQAQVLKNKKNKKEKEKKEAMLMPKKKRKKRKKKNDNQQRDCLEKGKQKKTKKQKKG